MNVIYEINELILKSSKLVDQIKSKGLFLQNTKILRVFYKRFHLYFINIIQNQSNYQKPPSKMSSKTINQQSKTFAPSDTNFPIIGRYLESQIQRSAQNQNRTQLRTSLQTSINTRPGRLRESQGEEPNSGSLAYSQTQNRTVIPQKPIFVEREISGNNVGEQKTIDSTPERLSESEQEVPDPRGLSQSQNQNQSVISEIPTLAETAVQRGEEGEERPRSFSEPNSPSPQRLQNYPEIVQPVVMNFQNQGERTEPQNQSIFSPEIIYSGGQNRTRDRQISRKWNTKTRQQIQECRKEAQKKLKEIEKQKRQSQQTIITMKKTLEKLSVKLEPFVPENIKNLQGNKSLPEKLRCFLDSFGSTIQERSPFQNTPQLININSNSPFRTIQQQLGFPKNNFTRLVNFHMGDIRKTDLRNEYFRVGQTINQYLIRGDRLKRGGQNPCKDDQMWISEEKFKSLSFISQNLDMIAMMNQVTHQRQKIYQGADKQMRLLADEKYLRNQIKKGVMFIFIQEAHCRESRAMIRRVVQTTKSKNGQFYYYPEHLDQDCDLHATIILSKYKVRFGRIQFTKLCNTFTEQTFCEFQVFNQEKQRIQTICLVCCHWKSSQGKKGQELKKIIKIRDYQKDCCNDFLQARCYNLMLLIGDTNLNIDETLENDQQFRDTYLVCRRQEEQTYVPHNRRTNTYKGTQLFYKDGKVIYVRPDRVLVDKANQNRVKVRGKIDDVYLPGCQSYITIQAKFLIQNDEFWKHIRPSDHHFLAGQILI